MIMKRPSKCQIAYCGIGLVSRLLSIFLLNAVLFNGGQDAKRKSGTSGGRAEPADSGEPGAEICAPKGWIRKCRMAVGHDRWCLWLTSMRLLM